MNSRVHYSPTSPRFAPSVVYRLPPDAQAPHPSPSSPPYAPAAWKHPMFDDKFDFRTLRSPRRRSLDMAADQVYATLHAATAERAPFSFGAPAARPAASTDVLLISAGTYPGLDYEQLRAYLVAKNPTFEGLLHCTDNGDFVFRYADDA